MANRSLSISNAMMMIAVTSVASMTSMAASQSHAASTTNYQTYVIHTYGGEALLPAVWQQLAGTGSTAAVYQDRLILRTTPSGYQAVQQLLSQIDGVSQAITIAVRVGKQVSNSDAIQQNRIIINNNGIQGYGNYGNQTQSSQGSSFYQVQTLSGKPASISTSTLLSLAQPLFIQQRSAYNRLSTLIVIQGQTLVTASQGIAVTPRLLPNGQVQVSLNQVEEQLTNNRHAPIGSQSLNTTITLPKGQWVTIGSIRQNNQGYGSGVGSSWSQNSQYEYPIEIKVQ